MIFPLKNNFKNGHDAEWDGEMGGRENQGVNAMYNNMDGKISFLFSNTVAVDLNVN